MNEKMLFVKVFQLFKKKMKNSIRIFLEIIES